MIPGVTGALLGETSQVMSQNFCTNAERLDEHLWKVNCDFSKDRWSDHPHGLAPLVESLAIQKKYTHMAFGPCCPVVYHDTLGFKIQDLLFLGTGFCWRRR